MFLLYMLVVFESGFGGVGIVLATGERNESVCWGWSIRSTRGRNGMMCFGCMYIFFMFCVLFLCICTW